MGLMNEEEKRQRLRANELRYRQNNREEYLARRRRYREANREKLREKNRDYSAKNKDAIAARRKAKNGWYDPAKARIDYYKNYSYYMLERARHRAKRKGIDCTIKVKDISIPPSCPVFGVPFVTGYRHPHNPSLDRIDNTRGYVPGNICVISNRANSLKVDATLEEIRLLAAYMTARL